MFRQILPILLAILCFACKKDNKDSDNEQEQGSADLKTTVLADNLALPWELVWGPDNQIWFTEKGGKISRLNPSTKTVTPVFTIPDVLTTGEGGLLGMVLHPSFTTTPQVFVVYNYNGNGGPKEKVVRYTYNGTTLSNPTILVDDIAAANVHNGSRLLITDQKLFITTGDAADTNLPQNNSSLNGKVLRINLDGTIPADNPVAGNRMWSKGHRNAQGLVMVGSAMFSSEHGPNNDDEINIITKGGNYGWPNVMGPCDGSETSFCNANNVVQPIKAWTPTLAVSGLEYYNHDLIPQWKNSLLLATLKHARVMQLKLNDARTQITETNEHFEGEYGRIRDFCISPDGKVYLCTSNGSADKIVEIAPR